MEEFKQKLKARTRNTAIGILIWAVIVCLVSYLKQEIFLHLLVATSTGHLCGMGLFPVFPADSWF